MIIGFGHKAQTGKDTAADYLVSKYRYTRVAFAEALKRTAMAAFGFTVDQVYGDKKLDIDLFWGNTPAHFLQVIGTDLFRDKVDQDFWVKRLHNDLVTAADALNKNIAHLKVVIPDVRFHNEAEAIKSWGGIVVRVDRDESLRRDAGRDPNHPSETALDDFTDWDYILDNNGSIDQLHDGVDTILDYKGMIW